LHFLFGPCFEGQRLTRTKMSASTASENVLILGIGNPLMGDDGAGIRVVEMLARKELPPRVKVEEAGLPGWGLPSWFEGQSKVILVDAVQMGEEPGQWKRLRSEEIHVVMEDGSLSLHQPDLACGLALSQALDLLPQDLTLYGIQPAQVSAGAALSPEVHASLPDIVENILNDLEKAKE
jgi:hydrogenase maturation protease